MGAVVIGAVGVVIGAGDIGVAAIGAVDIGEAIVVGASACQLRTTGEVTATMAHTRMSLIRMIMAQNATSAVASYSTSLVIDTFSAFGSAINRKGNA